MNYLSQQQGQRLANTGQGLSLGREVERSAFASERDLVSSLKAVDSKEAG